RFVRPRNTRDEVEMALGDCETVGELVERNGRSRLELACGHAGVSELRRERHRETAGVRRGEELFGVSADPILKPRAERVLRLLQHTAIRRNRAPPIFQTALPNRGRLALHGFSPFASLHSIRIQRIRFQSFMEGYIQRMTLSRNLCLGG